MEVRPIAAAETLALRQRVLRPHQPREMCVFPGDEAPGALHVGAFEGARLVGIATIVPESDARGEAGRADWRIRGMAVEPDRRGAGLGAALVARLLAHAETQRAHGVWCTARTPVAAFYESLGFRRAGPAFDLPGIGPHVVMVRAG